MYTPPLGIRLNNPGNLRQGYGMDYPVPLDHGYAHFNTMADGLTALCKLTSDYFSHLGLQTVKSFVSRYAPASENDLQTYIAVMCRRIGISETEASTLNTRLALPWNALQFMRAIVHIEQGRCPDGIQGQDDWFSPVMWVTAMQRADKWNAALHWSAQK